MPKTISGTYEDGNYSIDFVYLKDKNELVTSTEISKEIEKLIMAQIRQN